jgi:hypothetical protein
MEKDDKNLLTKRNGKALCFKPRLSSELPTLAVLCVPFISLWLRIRRVRKLARNPIFSDFPAINSLGWLQKC